MTTRLRFHQLLFPALATAGAVAVAVALMSADTAGARSQAAAITLTAPMDAAQEVPAPTGDVSAARGLFSATLTRADGGGGTLAWQLTFSGLTGAAASAHIHTGARGVAGPVAIPLCGPCESGVGGTTAVDAAVLQALQSGGAYANLHTAANKAGEVRGQIAIVASVRTTLTPRQEVPRPTGKLARARGTFTGTVTKEGATTSLAWRLTFAGLTGRALGAHIHVGARGKAGGVLVALCGPCRSGVRKVTPLKAAAVAALENGRAYVNVHTARNAGGEVRGQIAAVPLRITP